MTYQRQPTTLVARQGYSGLGVDTSAPCPTGYVKNAYGYCITVADAAAAAKAAAEPSLLTKGISAGVDLVKGLFGSKPTPVVVQTSSTPDWLMPVAIGGAALVVVMLIRKRSNPARRRRRSRR